MAVVKKDGLVVLKKHQKFNVDLLPAIQNLVSLGMSETDLGIILGHQGTDPRDFIKSLKQRNMDVKEACEVGKKMANVYLVAKAFQAATGYEFEEKETTYYECTKDGKKLDEPIARESKVKKRWAKPDTTLLLNLLYSRMPEDFSSIRSAKKNVTEIGDTSDEIKTMFGTLLVREAKRLKEVQEAEGGK